MFIDRAKIYIKAGNGGNGAIAFHREKYINAGGPDGGDGGNGGNVVFVVDEGCHTLADFRYKRKYVAQVGQNGGGNNCSGKCGEDIIVKVPAGTIVREEETGRVLADMKYAGQREIICKGGRGGRGNQHFATSTRQMPSFAKIGGLGEEYNVILELKLIADVGLIGFPNVGKSTILSMTTKAQPKIANYHFTTINPNLGVVSVDIDKSFVIADIPGLIEGAAQGVGLGHDFLKHIERTKMLVHVIDMSGSEFRNPIDDFKAINNELVSYNEKLATRPQIIVANKMDITGAEENLELFKQFVSDENLEIEIFPVSATTNDGLKPVIYKIMDMLDNLPETEIIDEEEYHVVYDKTPEAPYTITIADDGAYVVEGPWMYRVVGSTNFNDYDSLQHFQKTLKDKGVIKALVDKGVKEGDTVRMYHIEFDYVE